MKQKTEKHAVTHFSISFLPCRQKNSFVQKIGNQFVFLHPFVLTIHIPVEILTNKVYLTYILLKYFIPLHFGNVAINIKFEEKKFILSA